VGGGGGGFCGFCCWGGGGGGVGGVVGGGGGGVGGGGGGGGGGLGVWGFFGGWGVLVGWVNLQNRCRSVLGRLGLRCSSVIVPTIIYICHFDMADPSESTAAAIHATNPGSACPCVADTEVPHVLGKRDLVSGE